MSAKNLISQTYKVLAVFLIAGILSFSIGGKISSVHARQAKAAPLASKEGNKQAFIVTPASGGTLRFPLIDAPFTLDPAFIESPSETTIGMQIFEGLTQLDQNNNVIPGIASSWSSPDAVVWTFNLRNDVYFHNGRQVKAGDFVFSWNRAKSANGYFAFMFDDVSSFIATNDFTLTVTLTDPSSTFPVRVSNLIFSVVPSEAANTLGSIPVGTGAFKFVSWTAAKVTLQRSLNYYDAQAYLDKVDFKFYTDINTEWADFQASKLDLSPIPASQWNTVASDPNVITGQMTLMQAYGFDSITFPNVQVRKAFQRAIDRNAIATNNTIWAYDPLQVGKGVVSPGKGSYDNSDITIPFDPPGALTLLANAGWTDTNADGILDNGAGTKLNVVVQDFTSAASHARALSIANDLANIGDMGVGAAVTMTTDRNVANIRQLGWYSDYPAPDNDLLPFAAEGMFATRINYNSINFDEHLDTALESMNETERNAEFHAADVQLVLTDAAVIPLYYGSMIPVLKKPNVHDLLFTAQGYSNIQLKYAWMDLNICIPVLVTPENSALLDNGRNNGVDQIVWDFDWSSCPNATKYNLYVYHTGSINPMIDAKSVVVSTYNQAVGGFIADSNRFDWKWKVKAYVNGKWGNWSELRDFDVEPLNSDAPNISPSSRPILILPVNGSLTKIYTPRLDWSASIPSPDHYELQLSLDPDFLTLLNSETIAGSTSEFTPLLDLDPNTQYFWRVHAVNTNNESSAWSESWSFRTAILPPVQLSPTDLAILDNRRPSLDWTDVPDATGYKIVISPFADMSSSILTAASVGSSYDLPSDLPAKSKLYWRVKATAPNGSSKWSPTWSFTTGKPASVPVLLSPVPNALVKDYTPLLDWNNSTLPGKTTFKYYEIQINDIKEFSAPFIEASTTLGDLTDSDFAPSSDLAHDTMYFWRVRAVNTVGSADNFSAWSEVWYFRSAMDAPMLTLPADGTSPGTRKPIFDWGDVANNTGYVIQVSESSIFGTLLLSTTTAANVSTFTPTVNLPAGKTLHWRVRTKGPNGPSAWSTVFSFTTP